MKKILKILILFIFLPQLLFAWSNASWDEIRKALTFLKYDIIPSIDNTRDLGTASLRFKNIYTSGSIETGGSIVTDKVIAKDATGLKLYEDGETGIFIEDGGQVGINTLTPVAQLEVNGSIKASATSTDATLAMDDASDNQDVYLNTNGDSYFNGGELAIGTTSANTTLHIAGGLTRNVTTVNAATYNQLVTDDILNVTYTTTGVVAIDLKTAQTTSGRIIIVKDAGGNAATNNITISTEGSEKIDGADTFVINANYDSVSLYCDGSNWFIY